MGHGWSNGKGSELLVLRHQVQLYEPTLERRPALGAGAQAGHRDSSLSWIGAGLLLISKRGEGINHVTVAGCRAEHSCRAALPAHSDYRRNLGKAAVSGE
jgi:hypothetical protein